MQMLKSRRVERALAALGFELIRVRGSEFQYSGPNGVPITITLGHNEISSNSVKKALRHGGVDWDAFEKRY